MTKKWTNQNLPGALHYLTGNVNNRIRIFKRDDCCIGFFDVLKDLLRDWPARLIAYVVMPNHFHLIVNPRDGDIQGFGGALKSLAAKRIVEITGGGLFRLEAPDKDGSIHQVWQESFKDFPLWSGWMIKQKINYVHANPVKAGLVNSGKDYQWSSFKAYYQNANDPLPVDTEWWWPDDDKKLSEAMKTLSWRTYHDRYLSQTKSPQKIFKKQKP